MCVELISESQNMLALIRNVSRSHDTVFNKDYSLYNVPRCTTKLWSCGWYQSIDFHSNMHHRTRSSLVQVLLCRRTGDKPVLKPIMSYWKLDPYREAWNCNIHTNIFCHENAPKMSSIKRWPFLGDLIVLNATYRAKLAISWHVFF